MMRHYWNMVKKLHHVYKSFPNKCKFNLLLFRYLNKNNAKQQLIGKKVQLKKQNVFNRFAGAMPLSITKKEEEKEDANIAKKSEKEEKKVKGIISRPREAIIEAKKNKLFESKKSKGIPGSSPRASNITTIKAKKAHEGDKNSNKPDWENAIIPLNKKGDAKEKKVGSFWERMNNTNTNRRKSNQAIIADNAFDFGTKSNVKKNLLQKNKAESKEDVVESLSKLKILTCHTKQKSEQLKLASKNSQEKVQYPLREMPNKEIMQGYPREESNLSTPVLKLNVLSTKFEKPNIAQKEKNKDVEDLKNLPTLVFSVSTPKMKSSKDPFNIKNRKHPELSISFRENSADNKKIKQELKQIANEMHKKEKSQLTLNLDKLIKPAFAKTEAQKNYDPAKNTKSPPLINLNFDPMDEFNDKVKDNSKVETPSLYRKKRASLVEINRPRDLSFFQRHFLKQRKKVKQLKEKLKKKELVIEKAKNNSPELAMNLNIKKVIQAKVTDKPFESILSPITFEPPSDNPKQALDIIQETDEGKEGGDRHNQETITTFKDTSIYPHEIKLMKDLDFNTLVLEASKICNESPGGKKVLKAYSQRTYTKIRQLKKS